jgi:hypothetical protein
MNLPPADLEAAHVMQQLVDMGFSSSVAEAAIADKINSTPTVLLNGKDLKDTINIYNAAQFRSVIEG